MFHVIVPTTNNVAMLKHSQTLSRRSHTIRMRHEGHEIGQFGLQDVVEIASHLLILLWMSLWFILPGFVLYSFVKEQNFTAVSA